MTNQHFSTVKQWLAWQEKLHPKAVHLGLERIRIVAKRMGVEHPPYVVIAVGGTNGKGSSVAFLESILLASGYRVGTYTSPHLLRYNERIRVNSVAVDDGTLCRAFANVDAARLDVSLTYFEFGTLAALDIFREARAEVAILEVGLGGRLDAVNVVDSDAALVTSIDIDHVEWLGPDRNSIGREKAGIYRSRRPAVCADPEPPESLLQHVCTIGAFFYQVGRDYGYQRDVRGWSWWHDKLHFKSLPLPAMTGKHQLSNAAGSLMALLALSERLPICPNAIRKGLIKAWVPARFQIIPGPVEWILDVTHNTSGAAALAYNLRARACAGVTRGVFAMLKDKDVTGVAQALDGVVKQWYAATLEGPRGQTGQQLADALRQASVDAPICHFSSVMDACRAAQRDAVRGDRILVFGSFYTVAQILESGLREGRWPPLTDFGGLQFG